MNTSKLWALTGLTVIAAGIAVPHAHAQNPRTIYLYNASLGTAPAGVLGAKTAPWGNGEIKATRQPVQYEGASVMELTTRNFAEGARFDLKTPIDIESYRAKGFVRLRLKFADDARAARAGGFGGGFDGGGGFPGNGIPGGGGGFPGNGIPGGGDPRGGGFPGGGIPGGGGGFERGGFERGRGGFRDQSGVRLETETRINAQFGAPGALPQFGGRGGFQGPGGFPGGGIPGGGFDGRGGFPGGDGMDGGFFGQAAGPPLQATDIKELRVTLVRENGALMGRIPVDLEKITPDEGGWRLFVLPISEMKATPGGTGAVQRMVLTSDNEDTFFMAQAAIVIETGKMEVSIRPPEATEGSQMAEVTVKPGAITLIADVEAGAADPQVEWNFDADSVGNFAPPTPPGGFPGGGFPGGGFPGGGFERGGGFPGNGIPGGGDPRGGGFPGNGIPGGGDPRGGGFTRGGGFPGNGIPGGGGGFTRGDGEFPGGGGFPGGDGMFEITGPRVDARGLTATFTYPNEEQNYRVEVTVTDKSGKKEPVTSSILVKVRG